MKFVIEAAGLTVAGGKELALDLMSRLAGHTQHQFTFIVPDLDAYKAISGSNMIVHAKGSGLLHRAHLLNHDVPKICREKSADALLCLGNFVPKKRVCPTAVLLQNAWIVYGDPVADSRRTLREHLITAYGRHAYRRLGRDVTLITQTQVMKDHLCGRYGIAPERVEIVPNTLSLAKLGGNTSAREDDRARPFTFLCLAHYYAHKNIDILLDAVRRLRNYTGKSAKCVITIAPEQHPGARRLLERLGRGELAGRIENIGPVPSERLPQVYQSAHALIFPTLLESFSRTYLEALYFGLPILTSDRDFARHLCQNAAIYFDPLDAESVARAMARVMEDARLRQRLVENGRHILAQVPTWDEIAARFVEVLERTARGEPPIDAESQGRSEGMSRSADLEVSTCRPQGRRYSKCDVRESADLKVGATAGGTREGAIEAPAANDVRALFNYKARAWRSKYGPRGKLRSRVEQFTVRLAGLCLPPARILDLGCGTGEIAAAIDQRGYRVTACDFAEEMIAVARSHSNSVDWLCLEPDWHELPFADGSFDAIVASSVFEYLDDVPRVAAELSRVLRADGVLLATVPNPSNVMRKLEARLQSMPWFHRLSPVLRKVPRLDSYAAYLRLSRNRFPAEGWRSVLNGANFVPLDESEFSHEAWQNQSRAPLVLLALKRVATPEVEAAAFIPILSGCRPMAG